MSATKWIARGALAIGSIASSGYGVTKLALEPWAARRAEARMAAQLGVPVHVVLARLHLPAVVELLEVRSERGGARRVVVELAPASLLAGDARLLKATAEEVEAAGWGSAARVELTPATASPDGREHVRVDQARHARRPLAAEVLELDLDDDHAVRALRVQGAAWDGVTGIEGSATRDADTWSLRGSWPGLRATLRATSGDHLSVDANLDLNDARLPAHPVPWADLSGARVTGSLRIDGDLDDATIRIGLSARGVTIMHRALSSEPAEGIEGSVTGALRVRHQGRAIETERLELRSGSAAVALAGHVDRDGASDVTADMGVTHCADLLRALMPLLPALRGMEVVGDLAAHVRITAEARRLSELAMESEVDIGCGVTRDAPAADPGRVRLMRTIAALAGDPVRTLEQVGDPTVRAFLVGEDAKFFRHRGFDPWTIRRALAADLAAGAFVRGASTITQQLARNLFLDGDRNISRKLEEAIIAWRLEQTVTKREILEAWLHLIELGRGVRGVTDGARWWFGTDPAKLDEDRAARLAALAPAPRRGFDDAWARRYRDLSSRLGSAHIDLPAAK